MTVQASRVLINFSQLKRNIEFIRTKLGAGTKLCLPLKANAYGHGALLIASITEDIVDTYAVARFAEALELRAGGVSKQIYLLNDDWEATPEELEHYNIIPLVSNIELLRYWKSLGGWDSEKKLDIHLHIDTGMQRLGCPSEDLEKFIAALEELAMFRLTGLSSHLACADITRAYTFSSNQKQVQVFVEAHKRLKQQGYINLDCHLANSFGILQMNILSPADMRMVRPGIACYGYNTCPEIRPVMSLESSISMIKKIKAGSGVSYEHSWKADQDTNIAVLPIGYGDGYPRNLSNKSSVLVNGKLYPQVGLISMDLMMLDIGKNTSIKLGDRAVLFGLAEKAPSVETLAELSNTNCYEIITSIMPRLERLVV